MKCGSVPRGGVYLTRNTLRPASVEFVRLCRTNYARGRAQSHSNANPMKWFAFEACQKDFFDTLSAPAASGCGNADTVRQTHGFCCRGEASREGILRRACILRSRRRAVNSPVSHQSEQPPSGRCRKQGEPAHRTHSKCGQDWSSRGSASARSVRRAFSARGGAH